jgi:hypothetical protein
MKLNLRSTIVSTALAVSLLAISRFQYHLPIKELFGEQSNYYMYIGISQFLIGAYVVISMLVLGFVLYSHREHLPKLSRTLSAQAAVIIGMIIALAMNILWTMCGIGTLPRHGDNSLVLAYTRNLPATVPMGNVLGSTAFAVLAAGFSISAIVTSFIANGLGLMSFSKDLLAHSRLRKTSHLDLIIKVMTFLPPAIIALLWPNVFIKALDVVGGIGIVTLFGILPCLIALRRKEYSRKLRWLGGVFLFFSLLALLSAIFTICGVKPDTSKECAECHKPAEYVIEGIMQ